MSACVRYCQRTELGYRDPLVEALAEVARLTAFRDGLDKNVHELEAQNEKLRKALKRARQFISPDSSPLPITNREMTAEIDAALTNG